MAPLAGEPASFLQANSTGWRPDTDVRTWAEQTGLGTAADLTAELTRWWALRRYVHDLLGAG